MKRVIVSLMCVLLLGGSALADEKPWWEGKTAKTGFVARGNVVLRLGAGEADVVLNPESKEIVVTTQTKSADKVKDIQVKVNVVGSRADVRVSGPKQFKYRSELPTAADLKVRMSAGDLNVSGVDGNVDVELHAGDCSITLGAAPEDFGPIDLSVRAGDLQANKFEANKSGLFRHFRQKRVSKYRFHAHVGAGDLTVK